jgi:Family of unknown function (DUF6295)
VCTYETATLAVSGSGKGATGWFPLASATVYLDHPFDAPGLHTLNVDLRNPDRGGAARVAVELDPVSARELAVTILRVLASAPPDVLEEAPSRDG